MSAFFKRQLTDYVEYHRNVWNGVMHVFGILTLFFAAILPLNLVPIHVLGVQTTLAPILALPVLIYWLLLDAALGTAILGCAIILFSAAGFVATHATTLTVWATALPLIAIGIGFQFVGHRVFEQRQPALVDNPSHLLLGPMFVMAKLFIALGFRPDLAAIIHGEPHGPSSFTGERQPLPRS
ncbi:MAG: DUF962 domain-containing protein [Bradyrhizobium sp.]|nr:DUF962 domain-containing protein [Bradyrhizobium sp.]